jgi:hypothetical protein
MMIPTVHSNGTGRQALLAETQAAWNRLDEAHRALRAVTVHGRDYYVQGPDAYRQAREEMDGRLDRLEQLMGEVAKLYCGIETQEHRGAR